MNQRIDELLDKYWAAESSLDEEQELKALLLSADDYEGEKALFSGLKEISSIEPILKKPIRIVPIKSRKLINWAASIAILIGSVWGWTIYEKKQAERKAYMEVMQAFVLIQKNLSRGQEEMRVMNDLRYLNTPTQLFDNAIVK